MDISRVCRACARNRRTHSRLYATRNGPRDYNAAVAALNTLQSNYSAVEAIKKHGPGWNKLALPEMIGWVHRIGYEPTDFNQLNPIHVAGTKGKGSTSSFVSSILAQYLPTRHSIHAERLPSSVGLYTSPHLRSVRERIQINNRPISEELFAKCFWELWDRLESTQSTDGDANPRSIEGKPVYFHYLTLMALHCYVEQKIGTAVIECGIGGEYDTTNILARPSVTGVTSLGIDHESMLGNILEDIAWHKGGIFKPEVPAFTVSQPAGAMEVLQQRARERLTQLEVVQRHSEMEGIKLGLHGEFQKMNASLAIAISAAHLQRLGYSDIPDPLDPLAALPDEFVAGLENASLGGRCDMRPDTKHDGLTWYIDGGHTLESIEVAGRWFASEAGTNKQSNRILIFNQQTRDASALANRLYLTLATALDDQHPFKHAIFCTNTTYKDAGYKADLVSINTNKEDVTLLRVQKELAATWDHIDPEAKVHVVSTIEEAVSRARDLAGGADAEVMVTGSLHLVGGLIEILESEGEHNESDD